MEEFTTYELVVLRGECLARLPENRKFRDEAPAIARRLCDQHIEAMESAIQKLNVVLLARGVTPEDEE